MSPGASPKGNAPLSARGCHPPLPRAPFPFQEKRNILRMGLTSPVGDKRSFEGRFSVPVRPYFSRRKQA